MSREDDQIYQMDVRWICAKWKVQPAQLVHVSSWQFNITKCHQFYSFFGIRVPTAWDAEAPILPQFPVGAAAWACRERGGRHTAAVLHQKTWILFFFKKIIFRCINMIQYVDIWLIFGCLGANYCDIYIYIKFCGWWARWGSTGMGLRDQMGTLGKFSCGKNGIDYPLVI